MKLITIGLCSGLIFTATAHADVALFTDKTPVIDGTISASEWPDSPWYSIDQVLIGGELAPEDFSGRYQLAWTESAIYLRAEINDDHLSDTYPNPVESYWDEDCLEIFVDADKSGGDHTENYNAFAYHLALDNQVVDIGPDASGQVKPMLFNDHVTSRWTRQPIPPYSVVWEAEILIYGDDYTYGENAEPLALKESMALGFMLAYCDADGKNREHFIGSHPITPVNGDKNLGYKDASVFDTLKLAPAK
ncbi:sugar-binding protein [Alteromonas sp. KUL49]|uniref:sugar-binding protein n=1 Tax=Alteromonas sp. KUL49 TaxID=2480798 RepID=UPI00102EF718|nr:sugar-binding protein [Alteromonas sp. KUL49]TAP38709.1 sugar-binding protein [Alteromonas sp. KUL49]GEA12661.1 hypothetical protein KUL49_30360 [Alteromonas sp. KUL49]